MGTEPRFVIVGTGRHGSGYISQLLTTAGIRCGHEGWWNPIGERTDGLVGDSSWCAVPFLAEYRGLVFHQVRHPLDVITSLVAQPEHGPYDELKRQIVTDPHEGPIAFAVASYLEVNELAEQFATGRWRVEDVDQGTLAEIGRAVGIEPDVRALEAIPRNVNRHHDQPRLDWDDLPGGPLTADLDTLAKRYGYE
jgi:hypothetical protein